MNGSFWDFCGQDHASVVMTFNCECCSESGKKFTAEYTKWGKHARGGEYLENKGRKSSRTCNKGGRAVF